MTFEPIDAGNLEDFKALCRAHRHRLDDSFLTEGDLALLEASDESPGWLAIEDGAVGSSATARGTAIGAFRAAASLVLDDYHRRGRRARFRILFDTADDTAEDPDGDPSDAAAVYGELLARLRPVAAAAGAETWFLFVKDGEEALRRRYESLGFRYERTGWICARGPLPVAPLELPAGVRIRAFESGRDEATYAEIRNAAFRTLAGSRTPLSPEDVAGMVRERKDALVALSFLEADGVPAGLVCGVRDSSDDGAEPALEIGPLAVRPEFQGRGFGTRLLRHVLLRGQEAGLRRAVLSVNGENRGALALYLREGFEVVQGLSCLGQAVAL